MGIAYSIFGYSDSSNQVNTQINDAITQQFSGTCDFECSNTISNINVDIVNSQVWGGVNIENACSVDGTCTISSSTNALTDILLKANQSTNASTTAGIFNVDISSNSYSSQVNQDINQSVSEQCKVQSVNDINNVDVFAINSQINGGINIGNTGKVVGNCALSNIMTAMESASQTIDQVSASGKKAGKCTSCSGVEIIGIYIGIGLAVIVGLVVIAYFGKKYYDSRKAGAATGVETIAPVVKSSTLIQPRLIPSLLRLGS